MDEKKLDKDINVRSKYDTEIDVGMIEKSIEIDENLSVWLLKDSIWKSYSLQKILDLIHRLQSEIAEYEQKIEDGELVSKDWHDEQVLHAETVIEEQKAEIERLTEERERVAWNKQEYLDWAHGLLSTHTEMKDMGEAYKMFDRDWLCGVFWAKIEGSIEYIIDLENQRNELQKQVDYLKQANNNAFDIISQGEKQILQIGKETAQNALEEFICRLVNSRLVSTKDDLYVELLETKDDLLKEKFGVEVE